MNKGIHNVRGEGGEKGEEGRERIHSNHMYSRGNFRAYTGNKYYHNDNIMKNGREGSHSIYMYSRGY